MSGLVSQLSQAGLRFFAACLPPAVAGRLGSALGGLFYCCTKRDRLRALKHLAYAFPERSPEWIERTARSNFRAIGRMGFTAISWLNREPQQLARRIYVYPQHRTYLKALIKSGPFEVTILADKIPFYIVHIGYFIWRS